MTSLTGSRARASLGLDKCTNDAIVKIRERNRVERSTSKIDHLVA